MAKQNLSRALVSLHRGPGSCWEAKFTENPVISTKTRRYLLEGGLSQSDNYHIAPFTWQHRLTETNIVHAARPLNVFC